MLTLPPAGSITPTPKFSSPLLRWLPSRRTTTVRSPSPRTKPTNPLVQAGRFCWRTLWITPMCVRPSLHTSSLFASFFSTWNHSRSITCYPFANCSPILGCPLVAALRLTHLSPFVLFLHFSWRDVTLAHHAWFWTLEVWSTSASEFLSIQPYWRTCQIRLGSSFSTSLTYSSRDGTLDVQLLGCWLTAYVTSQSYRARWHPRHNGLGMLDIRRWPLFSLRKVFRELHDLFLVEHLLYNIPPFLTRPFMLAPSCIISLTQLLTPLFYRFTPHPNPSRSRLSVPPTLLNLPPQLPTSAVPEAHPRRPLLPARSPWALALEVYSPVLWRLLLPSGPRSLLSAPVLIDGVNFLRTH